MTSAQLAIERPDAFDWPVDITATERNALVIALAPKQLCAPLRAARRLLSRFLAPLEHAATSVGLPESAREKAQRAVLLVMSERNTAWGCWDATTWIDAARRAGNYNVSVLAVAARLGTVSGADLVRSCDQPTRLARRLFGRTDLEREVGRVQTHLQMVGYGRRGRTNESLVAAIAALLISAGTANLDVINLELITSAHAAQPPRSKSRTAYFRLAHALHGMGILARRMALHGSPYAPLADVDAEWASWCARWRSTSTLSQKTIDSVYNSALRAGRWLARHHPEVRSPEGWTRELAREYVAAVCQSFQGDFVAVGTHVKRPNSPLSPRSKDRYLATFRIFLRDCQEWGWCTRHFDPVRVMGTPRAVQALISPNPRVIANDLWAKLLWAGLHLDDTDLPTTGPGVNQRASVYPLALVKATAIVWLFSGLRSDELVRLRLGCIRWQSADGPAAASTHTPGDGATCFLDVPTHKTGSSFSKPVDPLVGDAITAWEACRPDQPLMSDRKTGQRVAVLFSFRGRSLHTGYFNKTLIPLLCRKAGLPLEDARGRITSHRARATIASQLYNAKEPMTLFELQAWLGHRSPETTQHYARITPTTLSKAYRDAGYFARNVRTIEVLIDREAITSGAAANGTAWQYFDLGHGFCTYSFFEQCPHRMACARCDFYVPKNSTRAQLMEATGNLQRMLAEIQLTDDERAAVTDGANAVDDLLKRLADVPTPAGPTPRQMGQNNFIPINSLILNSSASIDRPTTEATA